MPLIPKQQPPYYEPSSTTGPIKVYKALLSQTGTDAPTVIVLQNTFDGPIIWTRNDVGYYIGTLTGAFPANKTFIPGNAINTGAGGNYLTPITTSFQAWQMTRANDNTIEIYSFEGMTGDPVDLSGSVGATGGLSIQIEVHP